MVIAIVTHALTKYKFLLTIVWFSECRSKSIITLVDNRTTKEIFIENLIRLRKNKNMSQQMLAEKAGVSSGIIGETETGHRNPTLKTIDKIACALEVPPYCLFIDHNEDIQKTDLMTPKEKIEKTISILKSIEI